MIPQAIASTGAYADLWSHLKSIIYALDRVQQAASPREIAELDRNRLAALVTFLKQEIDPQEPTDILNPAAFLTSRSAASNYSLDVDLRTVLKEIPSFDEWLKAQKLGLKDKAMRLIADLEDYIKRLDDDNFVPAKLAKPEFTILRDLLTHLLLQTESALVS